MTDKTTLLAYLVPTLTGRVEDTATEALAFILSEDEACLGALNDLLRDGGFDLEPIERVETQVAEKDGSRPDMTGYDRTGGKRLLVEAKFWAALGQEQASGYFDHLDEKGPGVLLLIVPESRRETLWQEIKGQMDKAGKELEHIETFEGGRRAQIAGSDKRLLLVSWDRLLRRMTDAVPGDSPAASDIRQLRGLARRQDDEAFQPIHAEELAPSLARRIRSINQLIDDVIDSGREELGITTDGLRSAPQREGYGRYFRFMDVEGNFFIGVNFDLWAARSSTPLWLWIGKSVRVDVEKLRREFPRTQQYRYEAYEVPIDLKTGEEHQAVLDDVVSQIRKIKDVVNGSSHSVDPPTHPE